MSPQSSKRAAPDSTQNIFKTHGGPFMMKAVRPSDAKQQRIIDKLLYINQDKLGITSPKFYN